MLGEEAFPHDDLTIVALRHFAVQGRRKVGVALPTAAAGDGAQVQFLGKASRAQSNDDRVDGFFIADSCPAIAPTPVPRSSKALLDEATSLVFTTATM